MKNADFSHELLDWTIKVIEAQKQFDEVDKNNSNVWYRPDLMEEAVREILYKGFER